MSNRPKLKKIREEMQEITSRQPTQQQIKDLGETFRKIQDDSSRAPQTEEQEPSKKIARSPEKDL